MWDWGGGWEGEEEVIFLIDFDLSERLKVLTDFGEWERVGFERQHVRIDIMGILLLR